jgi:hypothetical protein
MPASSFGQTCFDLVCDDLDFLLNNPASLGLVGRPTATDNCDNPTVTFTDSAVTPGDCAPTTLTRTFTATDSKGNSAVCTQTITLRKLTLGDVFLPPFTVPIECDEDFITLPPNQFGQVQPLAGIHGLSVHRLGPRHHPAERFLLQPGRDL